MTVIDFSADLPSAASIKQAGHEGVMLYCSKNRADWMKGKQPGREYLDTLDRQGLKFGFIYQYRGGDNTFKASDAYRGYNGGVADAKEAQAYLNHVRCGGHPVHLAVDFPCTLDEWNSTVSKYFKGWVDTLGKQRVGIYGHSRVVAWALEDQLVCEVEPGRALGMVTSSWSDGTNIESYATLHQNQHNVKDQLSVPIDISDVLHHEWGWRFIHKPQLFPVPKRYAEVRPNPNHRGDPVWLPMVLDLFGVPYEELEGWDQWGMGDFFDIWGVIVHHTGSNNTSSSYIARNPRLGNALSSQLHQLRTSPYKMVLCGVGIAWHAGAGSYPGLPTDNANKTTIGIEMNSNGTDPWPELMLDVCYRTVAAILWYKGHSSARCISHWEYSLIAQGKWDPGAGDGVSGHVMEMNYFRSRVQHYIDHPPFMEGAESIMPNELDKMYKSRVPGSDWTGTLRDMIINSDAHAFVARSNTEAIMADNAEMKALLKESIQKNNDLSDAINNLADAIREG